MDDVELQLRNYGTRLDQDSPKVTFEDVQQRLNQEKFMTLTTDDPTVSGGPEVLDDAIDVDLRPSAKVIPLFRRPSFVGGLVAAAVLIVVALAVVLAGDDSEPVITDTPTTTSTVQPTTTAAPTTSAAPTTTAVPEVSSGALSAIENFLAASTSQERAATMTPDAFERRGHSGNLLEEDADYDEMLEAERLIEFEIVLGSCEIAGAETIVRCAVTKSDAIDRAFGEEPVLRDLTFFLEGDVISTSPNLPGLDFYTDLRSWAGDVGLEDEFNGACPANRDLTVPCAEFVMQNLDEWAASGQ